MKVRELNEMTNELLNDHEILKNGSILVFKTKDARNSAIDHLIGIGLDEDYKLSDKKLEDSMVIDLVDELVCTEAYMELNGSMVDF